MKKILSIFLAAALLIGCAVTASAAGVSGFTDVPSGAYYAEAVAWAVENGVTSGTSATTFSPNAGCTRAQVVTFLWRAAGKPTPASTGTGFKDVPSGEYYAPAVAWAVEQGITSGTSATTFAPGATCTRAQIVTFLWRFCGKPTPVGSGTKFTDVNPKEYYAPAVQWAVENGVTSGTSSTTFSPSNVCTRGQVVTFLYRAMADKSETQPENPPETEPPATEHKHNYTGEIIKEATCTERGLKRWTCSNANCDKPIVDETIERTGHSWGEWVVTKEPTTEAEGEETRTCSACGATETRAIDKLPEETEPETGCTSHEYEWVCDSSWEFDTGTCKNCGETKVIYASSSNTSQAVLDAINVYRKANELPELQFDTRYNTRITMRATELTISFSHIRPDGSQSGKAECIATGSSAQSVADAWYNSSSHNGLIMNPNATTAAAAYNGSYWVVWVFSN